MSKKIIFWKIILALFSGTPFGPINLKSVINGLSLEAKMINQYKLQTKTKTVRKYVSFLPVLRPMTARTMAAGINPIVMREQTYHRP